MTDFVCVRCTLEAVDKKETVAKVPKNIVIYQGSTFCIPCIVKTMKTQQKLAQAAAGPQIARVQ